jgi:hypothetical protein
MADNIILPLFSAQQTARDPIRLSLLENKLRNLESTEYWQQRGKTKGIVCNVISFLGFPFISKNDECLLELQPADKFPYSSEHLVLYANLHVKAASSKDFVFTTEVVIKFRYIKIEGEKYVQNIDKDHGDSIIKNYNKLHDYVNEFHLRETIDVVPVCILRGIETYDYSFLQGINLWVEQKVSPKFLKFTDELLLEPIIENGSYKLDRDTWIVSTTFDALRDLQVRIYEDSNRCLTIVDLQGAIYVGNKFTLCDVEFTNTLGKFRYNSVKLLSAFATLNELPPPKCPIEFETLEGKYS